MAAVLLSIHLLVTLALVGIILMQRSEGGGLGMGGGGSSSAFMSARGTANFITKTTSILAAIFMLTSLLLAMLAGNHGQGESILDQLPADPAAQSPGIPSVPAQSSPEVPLSK